MDWNFAIDKHREALKCVLAMLVAMAGLSGGTAFISPLWGGRRAASGGGCALTMTPTRRSDDHRPPYEGEVDFPATLPRHLHRAVLRLLRPAESAVRRLVIVAARGLTVPPRREAATPPRKRKPASAFLKKPGGTGILLPRGMLKLAPRPAPRALALPLFDRLPRWESRPRRPMANSVPRISVPGSGARLPVAARPPLSPGDPLDAGRLHRRLAALAAALDDLPRAARRFARWRACRDAAPVQNPGAGVQGRKPCRLWPMRPGRPPGWRAPGSRHASAVHETLNDLHGLAFWALEQSRQKRTELPDTS